MERELLLEIRKMNEAVEKQLRAPVGEGYNMGVGGLRYDTKPGAVGGNTIEVMMLVSVGDEYSADVLVSHRIRNPTMVEKATKKESAASWSG